MNLIKANLIASDLIKHHCPDYSIVWDFSIRNAGRCKYFSKTINLSIPLTNVSTEDEFIDTVLHEIAHVIAGYEHDHDIVWKFQAQLVGCTGERTHSLRSRLNEVLNNHKSKELWSGLRKDKK